MKTLSSSKDKQEWLQNRLWSCSGNQNPSTVQCHAEQVLFPVSTQDVSRILQSVSPTTPVACVCGGHESANLALRASKSAVILDMSDMNGIQVNTTTMQVTVGPGTTFQSLAQHLRDAGGALPIGTGPDVGVVGYVVNGGLSGYFSRRLGLLGQCVTRLTVVTRNGCIRELSDDASEDTDDRRLFQCMLGAGSALGVVASITFSMAKESIFRSGGQFVVACGNRLEAQTFSHRALKFMRETVMADDTNNSVSMEVVVTADCAIVCTFIFYDTFTGENMDHYIADLRAAAAELNGVTVLSDNITQWTTWFEAASCLWPIIASMEGSPLAMLQHAIGTKGRPTDHVLDFVTRTWIGECPLKEAPQSIVEARTLGGAVLEGREIPTGNVKHEFFVDMIVCYDAGRADEEERCNIVDRVALVVEQARQLDGVTVDFSGTHSQPDDPGSIVAVQDIFGSMELFELIKDQKSKHDPENCFRFHPFHKIL